MKLTINGQERELATVENLTALIECLGMRQDRVAIELNHELVPRDRWSATPVGDGDRLEIVHFVGGGSSRTDLAGFQTKPSANLGDAMRPALAV